MVREDDHERRIENDLAAAVPVFKVIPRYLLGDAEENGIRNKRDQHPPGEAKYPASFSAVRQW